MDGSIIWLNKVVRKCFPDVMYWENCCQTETSSMLQFVLAFSVIRSIQPSMIFVALSLNGVYHQCKYSEYTPDNTPGDSQVELNRHVFGLGGWQNSKEEEKAPHRKALDLTIARTMDSLNVRQHQCSPRPRCWNTQNGWIHACWCHMSDPHFDTSMFLVPHTHTTNRLLNQVHCNCKTAWLRVSTTPHLTEVRDADREAKLYPSYLQSCSAGV